MKKTEDGCIHDVGVIVLFALLVFIYRKRKILLGATTFHFHRLYIVFMFSMALLEEVLNPYLKCLIFLIMTKGQGLQIKPFAKSRTMLFFVHNSQ